MGYWLKTINKKLFSFYAIAAFFILWEIAARNHWLDTQFVPAPTTILKEAWKMIQSGQLFIHISTSLKRTFTGFLLAVVIGVPLGFILGGWAPTLEKYLTPLFNCFAQVNPFTLFPLFIILFGIGETSKNYILFWAAIWPIFFTTVAGVQHVDPLLIKAAKAMNANGIRIFFQVILPGAATQIATGLKSGLTMAFMMLIGAEVVGAEAGLGWLIHNSQKNYVIPRLYVGLVTIAILGLIISYLLEWLERSIITWKEEPQGKTI